MKKIIFIISSFIATTFLPAQVTTGFQWAKSFGGSTADHSNNVILDASGNIYTTGSFSGTADFDPGAATYTLTSMGDNDIFILKLDASGNFVWAKQIGSTGVDIGGALSIDSLDNIFCVGIFSGPADFDPGINTNTLNVIGAVDSYILKLDVAGNFIWVKQLGGVGNTYINRCRNDAFGNTYIGGVFENTIDLDPGLPSYTVTSAGGYDLFISKLDPLGDLIWTKTSGGLSTDAVMNLVLDASSNVYSIGNFSGTVDFDPSSAVTTLTSNTSGSSDIFISKFDSNGNFKWAKNFGGTSINLPYSIAIDNDQNVYSTGFYIGVTDFDPANSNAIYGTYGNCDAFLLKLDSTGNYVWVKHFGGNGVSAFGKCLVTDASNNIYLTGYHNGTSDLDPSPTSSYSLTSAGGADLFITKLNSSGNFIWAHQIGGPEDDIGMDTKIDAAGSLYTTGYFSSTVDFDQTSSVFNIISSGENDAFIHKMNQLGLSVKENSYLNNVSLYPNPTSNYLNINLDEEVFKKLNPSSGLEVYNSLGVLVLKEPLDGPYTQVNIKKLSPGIFILKITDDNKLIYTHKIIKE